MEFDQTYTGAGDWNFPSPTATPTSASYSHNAFQTPKTASFPSHFQDAFSTPQMPGYATPRPTEYATMTPIQGQQAAADTLRNSYHAHVQAAGGAMNGQEMPPPGQAGYPAHTVSPIYGQPHALSGPPVHNMAFDSSQMQTPPPTRGTTAKKPQLQQVAFGTPSTIASRRFMTPQQVQKSQQSPPLQMQTPMQFPQLQFSPDVYQFGNMGPASAPVYPQTQMLWEQPVSPVVYNQQPPPMLDDPFAPSSSAPMQWQQSAHPIPQHTAPPMSFNTPAMGSFPNHTPFQRPLSAGHPTTRLAPPVVSTSVDPSLVYSSPVQPVQTQQPDDFKPKARNGNGNGRAATNRKDSGTAQQQKPEHKRSDTVTTADSVSTAASASTSTMSSRPPLQRSNTTGTTRSHTAQAALNRESLARSSNSLQVPRTASPLKRVGKPALGSISESRKSRPSVILTVDETGRARAVRTEGPEKSPTKAVRDRYPGLFDSDSSDEEPEEEKETHSGTASFSFSRGGERQPKAARLDPPIENLDGLNIPRSSSSASMTVTPSRAAIAAAAQLRRSGSLRKQTPSRNGQRRIASSSTPSIDTAPMDISLERRQSIIGSEDFTRGLNLSSDGTLDAHNRRWSMMSMEQQQSVSPTHPHQFSDMHLQHTPIRQGGQPSRLIRCSCGVQQEHGQVMIQCRSCTQWLHSGCVGFSSGIPPPSHFTCFLCTKPTTRLQMAGKGRRS